MGTESLDVAQWYAIWTRARHEQVVRSQLVQRRIEAFLPTVTRWSHWRDRRKRLDWPLFPGYCFAHFDLEARLSVLRCSGVLGIVSVAGRPAPVPDVELNSIRTLVTGSMAFDPCPLLAEGTMVEITGGPLRGVVGRMIRKEFHRATLILSVHLIGQAVRVEVDAADVEAY